jgi:cathepsin L
MKGLLLSILFLIVIVSFTNAKKARWNQLDNYTFEKYLKEYNKNYLGADYVSRKAIFESNLAKIRKHNNDTTKTWKLGVNHMADWTETEFKTLLGYKKHLPRNTEVEDRLTPSIPVNALPAHVDWREKNIITAVKDQGQCGSCWTFATAETVESHYALHTGYLTDLSEQQILDCTPNPNQCGGTGGCGGGTAELAMAQIIASGGLSSEWTYPYTSYSGNNFNCQFNGSVSSPAATISGYKVLPSNQYQPVLTAIATLGPLAITVDASSWSFYESGVFDGCNQKSPDLDHGVQLVGYGTDPKLGDYWTVRNSWAPTWGEDGYIRLRREGANPRCGIDTSPSDGTGCKNGPPQVTVCGTCGILYDVSYPLISSN